MVAWKHPEYEWLQRPVMRYLRQEKNVTGTNVLAQHLASLLNNLFHLLRVRTAVAKWTKRRITVPSFPRDAISFSRCPYSRTGVNTVLTSIDWIREHSISQQGVSSTAAEISNQFIDIRVYIYTVSVVVSIQLGVLFQKRLDISNIMASTDRSIYEPSASLSFRDTLDSSVSNHRASVLASKIAPHWSPDTLPNCEVCSRPFSLRCSY